MNRPPDAILPLLHSIEEAVVLTYKEYTRLADKDVEFVYEKLASYFKLLSRVKTKMTLVQVVVGGRPSSTASWID